MLIVISVDGSLESSNFTDKTSGFEVREQRIQEVHNKKKQVAAHHSGDRETTLGEGGSYDRQERDMTPQGQAESQL